jgi:hypothetical protein
VLIGLLPVSTSKEGSSAWDREPGAATVIRGTEARPFGVTGPMAPPNGVAGRYLAMDVNVLAHGARDLK